MALIIGIDDAGRGPILGSMFLAGVLINKKDESFLKSEGVNDSKQVLHPLRVKLAGIIKDTAINHKIVSASAQDIDNSLNMGVNLNTLEAIKTAEIINYLVKGLKEKVKIIVDCPSVNTIAWKKTLLEYILDRKNIDSISCEHKADVNHPSVSAASILAKVAREESVAELKKEYGNIGSGYPSDPDTKEFLKKNGKKYENSGIFRKTWSTWKALFPEKNQTTLKDF